MQNTDFINDEILEAFVDGQLDATHCEQVFQAIDTDTTVRDRVERLRRAKDLMKLGYGDAQPQERVIAPEPEIERKTWGTGTFGLAASVLVLVIGFAAGLSGYMLGSWQTGGSENQLVQAEQSQGNRLILHISESNPEHFAAALVYTREFLDNHDPQDGQIEVVANAGGLDLLRSGVSPFEEQISAMMRDYKNVTFYACANAIRALRNKGIEPVLIDDVDTGLPAFDRIVLLLQNGWKYKKVKSLLET